MTRTIFIVEYMESAKMLNHRAVKGSKHLGMNELESDAGLDQNLGIGRLLMQLIDEPCRIGAVMKHQRVRFLKVCWRKHVGRARNGAKPRGQFHDRVFTAVLDKTQ